MLLVVHKEPLVSFPGQDIVKAYAKCVLEKQIINACHATFTKEYKLMAFNSIHVFFKLIINNVS
jgi:hypothetical protein